jgi:hypothetical protein
MNHKDTRGPKDKWQVGFSLCYKSAISHGIVCRVEEELEELAFAPICLLSAA